jgi:hypothetical protein
MLTDYEHIKLIPVISQKLKNLCTIQNNKMPAYFEFEVFPWKFSIPFTVGIAKLAAASLSPPVKRSISSTER